MKRKRKKKIHPEKINFARNYLVGRCFEFSRRSKWWKLRPPRGRRGPRTPRPRPGPEVKEVRLAYFYVILFVSSECYFPDTKYKRDLLHSTTKLGFCQKMSKFHAQWCHIFKIECKWIPVFVNLTVFFSVEILFLDKITNAASHMVRNSYHATPPFL